MTTTRNAGLDGCDPLELFILCQEAAREHATRVPPPTQHEVDLNLYLLRRALETGKRGGVLEGAT